MLGPLGQILPARLGTLPPNGRHIKKVALGRGHTNYNRPCPSNASRKYCIHQDQGDCLSRALYSVGAEWPRQKKGATRQQRATTSKHRSTIQKRCMYNMNQVYWHVIKINCAKRGCFGIINRSSSLIHSNRSFHHQ